MWKGLSLLYLLVLRWTEAEAATQIGCPSGVQRIISFDPLLLPPENVNASSEDVKTNRADQLFGRNNIPFSLWCSSPSAGLQHSITVALAKPVVLTGIISSGFSNGYVSNFTVEYAVVPNNFTIYEDIQNEKYFTVPQIDTVFTLEAPFPVQWIRLTILHGTLAPSGRLCWHLTLIGCLLSEAVSPEITFPTASAHTTVLAGIATTPFCSSSTFPSTQVTKLSKRNELPLILKIIVPTTVLFIVMIIMIAAVGVVICINSGRTIARSKPAFPQTMRLTEDDTIKVLNNATLYKKSPSGVYLTLTSKSSAPSPPAPSPPHVLSSNVTAAAQQIASSFYEYPESFSPAMGPAPYEPVGGVRRPDSMVDNPHYNSPFHGQQQEQQPRHSTIRVMENECYSVTLEDGGYTYANIDSTASMYSESSNVYEETPQ